MAGAWRDSPLLWLGGALLGGLVGLGAGRFVSRGEAGAWELVGVDADTAIVWATLSVDDGGLLARQLTTELTVVQPGSEPLEHRAVRGPTAAPGPEGVEAGPDRLGPVPGGWELRVGGEGLGARIQARGADAGCPPTPGVMGGFVEDRADGRLLAGDAVLVSLAGPRDAPALYVLGPAFAAGVDPAADCPAWVRTPTGTWSGDAPPFLPIAGNDVHLGDWTLKVRHLGDPVLREGGAHLLGPERWLARLGGFLPPTRSVRRVSVVVTGPGVSGVRAGLLVERP